MRKILLYIVYVIFTFFVLLTIINSYRHSRITEKMVSDEISDYRLLFEPYNNDSLLFMSTTFNSSLNPISAYFFKKNRLTVITYKLNIEKIKKKFIYYSKSKQIDAYFTLYKYIDDFLFKVSDSKTNILDPEDDLILSFSGLKFKKHVISNRLIIYDPIAKEFSIRYGQETSARLPDICVEDPKNLMFAIKEQKGNLFLIMFYGKKNPVELDLLKKILQD